MRIFEISNEICEKQNLKKYQKLLSFILIEIFLEELKSYQRRRMMICFYIKRKNPPLQGIIAAFFVLY